MEDQLRRHHDIPDHEVEKEVVVFHTSLRLLS